MDRAARSAAGREGAPPHQHRHRARRPDHQGLAAPRIAYARSLNPDRLVARVRRVQRRGAGAHQRRLGGASDPRRAAHPLLAVPRAVPADHARTSTSSTSTDDDDFLTVVLPEFALDHWWQQLLHNQSALVLRTRLRTRPEHGRDVGALPRAVRCERHSRHGSARTRSRRPTTSPCTEDVVERPVRRWRGPGPPSRRGWSRRPRT